MSDRSSRRAFDIFDDVVDRLVKAVAMEEDLHRAAMRDGEIYDSTCADTAMASAISALECAVAQPCEQSLVSRTLFGALHTLNLAMMPQEARDRSAALQRAASHPVLQSIDGGSAASAAVDARLQRLRDLMERLHVLNVCEPCDSSTEEPTPTPGV